VAMGAGLKQLEVTLPFVCTIVKTELEFVFARLSNHNSSCDLPTVVCDTHLGEEQVTHTPPVPGP
jgi:hypothetical protein